ncbi:MAG TPA: nucleotidyltransferase domain-containing protein [Anaerolineae bacterium]|nr:nucleotidyltransferase domain-containing protein [Anaerolineae bacterium]
MAKDIQPLLRKIVEILVAEYQPERIILFGSHACGEPDRASDIDLLILKETDESFPKRWAEVCELAAEIVGTIPFSPLVITPTELEKRRAKGDQFFEEILTRGKVLYAR